jgi:hypothetical protein
MPQEGFAVVFGEGAVGGERVLRAGGRIRCIEYKALERLPWLRRESVAGSRQESEEKVSIPWLHCKMEEGVVCIVCRLVCEKSGLQLEEEQLSRAHELSVDNGPKREI